MESSGRGYEFIVMENRVKTQSLPTLSFIDRLKRKKVIMSPPVKEVFMNRWYVADLKYITSVGEVRNEEGKTYNTRCAIYSSPDNTWVVVKGRFMDVVSLIENRFEHKNTIKGYGR